MFFAPQFSTIQLLSSSFKNHSLTVDCGNLFWARWPAPFLPHLAQQSRQNLEVLTRLVPSILFPLVLASQRGNGFQARVFKQHFFWQLSEIPQPPQHSILRNSDNHTCDQVIAPSHPADAEPLSCKLLFSESFQSFALRFSFPKRHTDHPGARISFRFRPSSRMAFESNRQSPAGDRSGLGIRDNHKSRRAAESDEEFTNDSEGDKNAQRGGVERSEPCTKFDRATHESQRYKQKTEALKKQNANLGDASRIPSAENAAMHHGNHSLRAAHDQIAAEKKEVANLQKERLPASRGQSWISNWNFLSGTRESVKAEENAEENAIAEAHKKIERREQKIRALEDENRNMQQKMSEQADRMTKHHEHRIGSLDDKNRKLQQKSERVDRMAQHYEQRIGSLEEKNHKLQHTVSEQKDHIHQQTLGFVEELEALKSKAFIDAPRLSDTEVQTRWRALGFAVRQFVSVHLPESLDPSTVQQLAYMDTFSWLPGMMEALRAPIFCSAFLESWMWHFLWRCIFDSHSKLWAGEAGSLWGTLRDVVQGECLGLTFVTGRS